MGGWENSRDNVAATFEMKRDCMTFLSTEATCITEMSVLLACWKQNNFVDSLCFTEITSFYTCVETAKVRRPPTLPVGISLF